jgi:hypothetical protein
VWAVGTGPDPFDPGSETDPAAEHWDGTSWKVVTPARMPEDEEELLDVSAAAADDVWAVGSEGQPSFNDKQIEIQHWNGTAWSFVSPLQASFNNILSGVAAIASDDVWAVGDLSTGGTGRGRALVEHWNGSAWNLASIPDPAGTDSLSKVSALSANDVWAVGSRASGFNPSRPLIMHWDGSTWSMVPSPTVRGKTTILNDVTAVSPNDVWAVGSAFNASIPSISRTVTEHWDGTRWSIVRSADTGNDNADELEAVASIASDDVWAVGNYVDGGEKTLAEHWDGVRWTIVTAPDSFDMPGAAAVATDDVWAVGSVIFAARILHWNGSTWTVVPSP